MDLQWAKPMIDRSLLCADGRPIAKTDRRNPAQALKTNIRTEASSAATAASGLITDTWRQILIRQNILVGRTNFYGFPYISWMTRGCAGGCVMRRPTKAELANLIPNLEALGRVVPGDKLSVTSDRFSVQRKGFFSQSVARTFSKNSARAYYLPVYRLFQVAVVDRLWNGLPQPWAQIDAAFAGLANLRQTYVLELEEARDKNKAQAVLDEKNEKVLRMDRLITAVTLLVNSPRNVNPEGIWVAAPRGYGRSRVFRFSNALKQRIFEHRRHGTADGLLDLTLPFDKAGDFSTRQTPVFHADQRGRMSNRHEDRKVRVSRQFKADAIDRAMTLTVNGALPFDHYAAGYESTMLYYLNVLHGDTAMLEEITIWCNQGVLGSVISSVASEGIVPHVNSYNFLTASGIPFSPSTGSPIIKFNLFEVRTRKTFGLDQKLHDEVAEASIHVSMTTDPSNFQSSLAKYAERGNAGNSEGEWGLNARCPLAQINIEFDFVILRTGPTSYQYQILNEQMIFETRPDVAGSESPRWMIQLEAEAA